MTDTPDRQRVLHELLKTARDAVSEALSEAEAIVDEGGDARAYNLLDEALNGLEEASHV